MSKRVTRSSTRAVNATLNDVSNTSPAASALVPPRKRARKQSAQQPSLVKLGAKNGGLQFITRFPLDVLYSIFGLLQPRDLLALIRTTKALRSVLLNRSSASVWLAAIQNVGTSSLLPFPPCPAHMQLPQYASRVFDTHCMICFKENGKIQLSNLQLRVCGTCAKRNLAKSYDYINASRATRHLDKLDSLFKIIPRCIASGPYFLLAFKPQMDVIIAEFNEVPPDEREVYVQLRRKELDAIEAHEEQLDMYFHGRQFLRSVELESLRDERLASILERLSALGWDEEIVFDSESIIQHPLVNKPQALTERIWSNIKDELLALMETIRQDLEIERFAEEIADKEYCRLIKFQGFASTRLLNRVQIIPLEPRVCDIMSSPIFKPLLEHLWLRWILEDLPDELPAFEARAIIDFPAGMAVWRRAVAVALYDYMASNDIHGHLKLDIRKSEERKLAWLNRATTSFKCTRCIEQPGHAKEMRYPYILAHSCQRSLYSGPGIDCARPSAHRGLQFNMTRMKLVIGLLTAAGIDSHRTTYSELDTVDARFICCKCPNDPGVMTWWRCLEHYDAHHAGEKARSIEWKRIDGVAEAKARELAPALTDRQREGWRCLPCFNRSQRVLRICPSWEDALSHVRDEHDLEEENISIGEHLTREDNYVSVPEPHIIHFSTLRDLGITEL